MRVLAGLPPLGLVDLIVQVVAVRRGAELLVVVDHEIKLVEIRMDQAVSRKAHDNVHHFREHSSWIHQILNLHPVCWGKISTASRQQE